MNYYKLDDKVMDAQFLKGEAVLCRAVLTPKEIDEGRIREGDTIVVMLSNGSKYKGRITSFRYVLIDEHAVGEIGIRKDSPREPSRS
jgi:hypothetical protein